MWYLITGLICVFLIWKSNKERNGSIAKYLIVSLLLPPLGYALWQAEKPLIKEEKRHGGKDWNVLKWFVISYTVMCVIWAFYEMFIGAKMTSASESDAEKVDAVMGMGLGIMMIMITWFLGVVGALKEPIIEDATE